MSKRQIVIGSDDMGFPGGVTTVAELLKQGFERRGIDVFLMSLDYEGAGSEQVYHYGVKRRWTLHNKLVSLNGSSPLKWFAYACFTPVSRIAESLRFKRFLSALDEDACFIFFKPAIHQAVQDVHAKRMRKYNVLNQFHNNMIGFERTGWESMYRKLLPNCSKFLVLDSSTADAMSVLLDCDVLSIRNPIVIPDDLKTEDIVNRAKKVTVVARLVSEKRLDLSIEAFARATQGDSDWTMSIYGDGPDQARLASLVEHLGLSDRVTLEGYTSAPLEAFSSAQIMMLNSVFEGMPMTVLEGFAVGVPLVATDACETVERAAMQAGRLVREAECVDREALVEALAASLKELMDDDTERERLSAEARKFVEPYALDAVVDEWIALIDSL